MLGAIAFAVCLQKPAVQEDAPPTTIKECVARIKKLCTGYSFQRYNRDESGQLNLQSISTEKFKSIELSGSSSSTLQYTIRVDTQTQNPGGKGGLIDTARYDLVYSVDLKDLDPNRVALMLAQSRVDAVARLGSESDIAPPLYGLLNLTTTGRAATITARKDDFQVIHGRATDKLRAEAPTTKFAPGATMQVYFSTMSEEEDARDLLLTAINLARAK